MSPFKTVIVFTFLSLIGVFLIPRFSIDLSSSQNLPKLTISYSLLNASPEIVEQEATGPLENIFSQISDVSKIYSVSGQNEGTIEITFHQHVDLAFKKFEVSSLVRQLYPKLHKQLSYPTIEHRGREDDSKKPLLLYQINSNLATFQIRKVIEDTFVPELSQLNGVREVSLRGAEGLQITIDFDYQKLKLYNLSSEIIAKTIRERFSSFYPGSFSTTAGQKLLIKAEHVFYNISDLQNLSLPTISNNVRLRDIAEVYIEESKPHQHFRINGLNSITLAIYADEDVNRLELATNLKESVLELSNNIPVDYQLHLDYDDTKFLTKEIRKNYLRSGLALFTLVVFIIISYRSWSHLLVLFTGIAVNLSLTSVVAYFLGVNIHLYTIAGISISFGMIMDNNIIMVDHLYRNNNNKIFRAILGATLTTIMSLLLVFLLPEEEQHNLTDFSIIIAIALCCSILVSTFYVPAVYRLTFKKTSPKKNKLSIKSLRQKAWLFCKYFHTIAFISRYRKIFIALLILGFGIPIFSFPAKWEDHNWYNMTIGSEFYQEKIRPYSDKILGGSLRLFVRNVSERSGYREPQRTELYVYADLPYGNTLEEMNRVMKNIEGQLKGVDGISKYITQVWSGQNANITITFNEGVEKGPIPYALKSNLVAYSLDWTGVKWKIFGVGQGFSSNPAENLPTYSTELRGYNYDALALQAEKLAGKLLSHKRIQKVNTNERLSWSEKSSMHYMINFNRQQSSNLHLLPAQVARSIHEKGSPALPQLLLTVDESYMPVFIKSKDAPSFSSFDVMESSYSTGDKNLKLAHYATLKLDQTASSIHKEDRQYIRSVGFEYFGTNKFGNEYLDKVLEEMKMELPIGYTAKKISQEWDWEKANRQYGLLVILMIGIFIICSIIFENIKQPFYIIVTIPVSFIGIFLTFGVLDFYFDQGGYTAFVLLGGLVVNASIFVLNDLNDTKKINYNRSLIKALAGKLKPIILSNISTCLGLLPFIIGGKNEVFWFALSAGTIGGLIFSLFSVLILLPVLAYETKP